MDGGGSDYIEKGLRNGWQEVKIRGNMKEKGGRFFLVCNFLIVAIFRLLGQLLMNSVSPMIQQSSCLDQCKDRYEGLMLRYDEELRSPSRRTKGHIEIKEHPGMGSLCYSTLDLCCRQLIERMPKTSKGCPQGGQNETKKIKNEKET